MCSLAASGSALEAAPLMRDMAFTRARGTAAESPDVAYVDGANGHGQMLSESGDVRGLTVLFNVIRSAAVSAEESENLIRTIMEAGA